MRPCARNYPSSGERIWGSTDLTPAAAIHLQERYRHRVVRSWHPADIRIVAGVDTAFAGDVAHSAVVLLDSTTLQVIDSAVAQAPARMPYIPGLLSFRELPTILAAFGRLTKSPDLIFVDGQGILHPRRFGIASHLGVELDLPTIGCAKSLLCGSYDPPSTAKGCYTSVHHNRELIGVALRSRARTREIFISVGHKISLEKAVELTLAMTPKYRLPEPIRIADRMAGEAKRSE